MPKRPACDPSLREGVSLLKEIFQHEPSAIGDGFVGEDLRAQPENFINRGEFQALDKSATYALACSFSHHDGRPSSDATARASSSEYGIDITSGTARVVGQCHGCSTEDVEVGDDPTANKAVTETLESTLDRGLYRGEERHCSCDF